MLFIVAGNTLDVCRTLWFRNYRVG